MHTPRGTRWVSMPHCRVEQKEKLESSRGHWALRCGSGGGCLSKATSGRERLDHMCSAGGDKLGVGP